MPRVSPLNSQVAFHSQVSGTVFNIADASEGFHGSCLDLVSFPVPTLTLSRLSASFLRRIPLRRPAEPTSLTQPLPSHLGLSLRLPTSILRLPLSISVLSMN